MLKIAFILLQKDLRVAIRRRAAWTEPFVFFTIVMILFPLATSAEKELIEQTFPAIIWVSVLFANFLTLERLLRPDFNDGSLEQLLIAPYSLATALLMKVLAYWLVFSLPLVLLAPFYAMLVFLPLESVWVAIVALALGTLTVNLIGAISAALVVTLHRNSLLSGLIVMPLYIPSLMFGAHAISVAASGLDATGQLAILGAMLILALILAPTAAALALRVTLA